MLFETFRENHKRYIYNAHSYLKESNISNNQIHNLFDVLYKSTYEKDISAQYWETILETAQNLLAKIEEYNVSQGHRTRAVINLINNVKVFASFLLELLSDDDDD